MTPPGRLTAAAVTALAACPEAVDPVGLDADDDASFVGAEVGVFVLAQVLLGEHVDVLERPFFDDLRGSAHHHVAGLLILGR